MPGFGQAADRTAVARPRVSRPGHAPQLAADATDLDRHRRYQAFSTPSAQDG
jgi:hypothetical protein